MATYVWGSGGLTDTQIFTYRLADDGQLTLAGPPFALAPPPPDPEEGGGTEGSNAAAGRVLPPVGWISIHPSGRTLYAADKTHWPGTTEGSGCIRAFALDQVMPSPHPRSVSANRVLAARARRRGCRRRSSARRSPRRAPAPRTSA